MSAAGSGWVIERHAGAAGDLHGLGDPESPRRTARLMRIDRPALVLGSTQRAEIVDSRRAEREGVDVVRRRSGGGAVFLRPGDHVWMDLLVPVGDRIWDDDVSAAAHWAGASWAAALLALGWPQVDVHRGGLVKTGYSRLVCFAGLGPGEVHAGDRKVVGLSQRRNRHWTRIQTIAYLAWEPIHLVDLLVLEASEKAAVLDALDRVVGVEVDGDDLAGSVLSALPRH